jgi:hypothetical protein
LDRLELVAGLHDSTSASNLVKIIPRYLESAAYDLYAQMEKATRDDETKLKAGLKAAFGMSPALAFAKFKMRTLGVGESPDAFVAELRRLARTVASGGDSATVDHFVVCQFVDGLPEPTRAQLRAITAGKDWTVTAALECAKSMLQQQEANTDIGCGFLGRASPSVAAPGERVVGGSVGAQRDGPRCNVCNRWGHATSECRVRCYGCNEVGHLRRDCTKMAPGNGNRGPV